MITHQTDIIATDDTDDRYDKKKNINHREHRERLFLDGIYWIKKDKRNNHRVTETQRKNILVF